MNAAGASLVARQPLLQRFLHAELEYVEDVFILVFDFQDLVGEALAVAVLAGQRDIGEKLHIHLDLAGPFARFTAAARNIK